MLHPAKLFCVFSVCLRERRVIPSRANFPLSVPSFYMCVRCAECFIIIFSILHLACRKFAHGRTFVIHRLDFFPHVKYIYFGRGGTAAVLFRRQKREMGKEKRGAQRFRSRARHLQHETPRAAQINFES
jgi:hypothetical protein